MWMLLGDLIGGPAVPQVISDDHGYADPRQPLEANAIRMRFEMGVGYGCRFHIPSLQESDVLVNWLETGANGETVTLAPTARR